MLELSSLSFFIKWWNSAQPFFFCMNKKYFCETLFLRKIQCNFFFYLMKCTSMDFFRLFGFWQESHWILYFFFLKTIYLYIIYHYFIAANFPCCFLEEFHSVLLLATIWRPNLWVLRKIWLSECLPFENYCFHKNVLYLKDILLTSNIWKTFVLDSFL